MRFISVLVLALLTSCGGDDDGGSDAGGTPPVVDSGNIADAGTAADAGGGGDAGSDPCGSCTAREMCCDMMCVRSVSAGTDGRADPSFAHCGSCGMACDAARASSCSILLSPPTPECACGPLAQCSTTEVCTATASGFACMAM